MLRRCVARSRPNHQRTDAPFPQPTERPLPLPSVDPEHADLGLPSPHSPNFNPPPADEHANDVEEAKSPPPMVLEEVEEDPSRGSLDEREREGEMGVAQ